MDRSRPQFSRSSANHAVPPALTLRGLGATSPLAQRVERAFGDWQERRGVRTSQVQRPDLHNEKNRLLEKAGKRYLKVAVRGQNPGGGNDVDVELSLEQMRLLMRGAGPVGDLESLWQHHKYFPGQARQRIQSRAR